MNHFKVFFVLTVFTLFVPTAFSHAATSCEEEISTAALATDQRVQRGAKNCKAENIQESRFGVGHGIVGSVDVTCPIVTSEGNRVNSTITYDFHLAPGSCEVLSIEVTVSSND